MVALLNTGNNNDISAFLTVALISHTQKVESSHAIVDLWDEIRKNIPLNSNIEYIAALLATGRIMDLKKEITDQKFVDTLNEFVESILRDLEKRQNIGEISDLQFVSALITSAYISRTNEIEPVNAIVDRWKEINEKIKIQNGMDVVSGILTTGRLMEDKYRITNIEQIYDLFNLIKDSIKRTIGGREITQKDIAAAFLTNANVEISPKVEKIQNIIEMWKKFERVLLIKDDIDYTVTLLTYGRVKDINVQFFVSDSVISEIKASIRSYINTKL